MFEPSPAIVHVNQNDAFFLAQHLALSNVRC